VHPVETAPQTAGPATGAAVSATVVAAIPARYGSTRLPAKPLAQIAGRSLIEHVYRRAAAAEGLARVVVLTDDERIAEVVASFGGEWEMTPAECASGTDRIAWAARSWRADAVVNVQGDWLIEPSLITALARHLAAHPGDRLVTLAVPASADEFADPNAVKVVCDRRGYALYFSRSPLPYWRDGGGKAGEGAWPAGAAPLKHWGIYGYRRDTLLELAALAPTPLERCESLEQLRALENGIAIRVLQVAGGAHSIDTPQDLARVERALRAEAAD
jgi:3-deoxy-manno-octulosonate cytidylyltransferase (CMP-KDO synthetase)